MSQIIDGVFERNEVNQNAMSGSELMATGLIEHLGKENLEGYQIILSRLRDELRDDKIRLFWAHDLPEDPEAEKALGNNNWRKFHRIVFVSVTQCQQFIEKFRIPWSRTIVLRNAIDQVAIPQNRFDHQTGDTIRFIYHTTPHRGLSLLVPVFEKLQETNDDIHLDVYSSFKLYGWEERDKSFQPLYDRIIGNDCMTYHGSVDNQTIREALVNADVFAYPSVWTETSCIALIEAMSAGLVCIHPNNGALFETAANWTFQYHWSEDMSAHASHIYTMAENLLPLIRENNEAIKMKRRGMKSAADINFSWDVRQSEWKAFLESIKDLPREFQSTQSNDMFTYRVV